MLALPGFAREFESGELTYRVLPYPNEDKVYIAGPSSEVGNNISGELNIKSTITDPNSFKQLAVRGIDANAFIGCIGLTSIKISIDSINKYIEIDSSAFQNCTGLTSITLTVSPYYNGQADIRSSAFKGCTSLTSANLRGVLSIGNEAFSGCSALTDLYMSSNTEVIGSEAFKGCSSLTSISLRGNVHVTENAFAECPGIEFVRFTGPNSDGPLTIEDNAFPQSNNLSALFFLEKPNSVNIAENAFAGCCEFIKTAYPNTMSDIFPSFIHATPLDYSKAAYIVNNAVYDKEYKEILFVPYNKDGDYAVPSEVTVIGESAYRYLPNLKTTEIHNDVTTIGNQAFASCDALENVILPMKLETLGSAVFENSNNIKNVVFNGPSPVESTSDVFSSNVYENATLYVRSGRQTLFMTVSPWKFFYNITDEPYSGIDEVIADFNEDAPYEVFNLNGVKIAATPANLPAGIYIIRQGDNVKKIAVK